MVAALRLQIESLYTCQVVLHSYTRVTVPECCTATVTVAVPRRYSNVTDVNSQETCMQRYCKDLCSGN